MTRLSPWLRESALRDSKLSVREILDWLTNLSVCLSVSVCLCLSVCLYVCQFICLSAYLCVNRAFGLSVY